MQYCGPPSRASAVEVGSLRRETAGRSLRQVIERLLRKIEIKVGEKNKTWLETNTAAETLAAIQGR